MSQTDNTRVNVTLNKTPDFGSGATTTMPFKKTDKAAFIRVMLMDETGHRAIRLKDIIVVLSDDVEVVKVRNLKENDFD